MFGNLEIMILTFIEAIGTYINTYIGTRRYCKYEDRRVPDSKYDKIPSLIIRKHFKLKKVPMHIITYLRFLITYYLFVRMLALPVLCLILSFNVFYYYVAYIISFVLLVIPVVFVVILEGISEHKSKRNVTKTKKGIRQIFKEELEMIKIDKECNEIFKKSKYQTPLKKELSRCLKKQKCKTYFPENDILYYEKNIYPRYQKYVYYEISKEEGEKPMFFVYDKSDNEIIFQAEIKK